ncbi:MAG TPA: hypothetical protein VEF04_02630 [Blastocatellia bacterium]|nr:hypothetical protein [Blastocatellia bacterium]
MKTHLNVLKIATLIAGFSIASGVSYADDDDIAETKTIAAAAGLITLEQATEKALYFTCSRS